MESKKVFFMAQMEIFQTSFHIIMASQPTPPDLIYWGGTWSGGGRLNEINYQGFIPTTDAPYNWRISATARISNSQQRSRAHIAQIFCHLSNYEKRDPGWLGLYRGWNAA